MPSRADRAPNNPPSSQEPTLPTGTDIRSRRALLHATLQRCRGAGSHRKGHKAQRCALRSKSAAIEG